MNFESVFEIVKIIAVVFGLLVLVVGCISAIEVIIVFSVVGLGGLIRERTHYVDAEILQGRLECIYARHADQPDFARGIIQAEREIKSMLKGD